MSDVKARIAALKRNESVLCRQAILCRKQAQKGVNAATNLARAKQLEDTAAEHRAEYQRLEKEQG